MYPLSPAVDAEAVCQQICSTKILHQGSHTTTHQMKPQSTTKLRNSMKEKARSSHNAPSQIFAESVSNCADAVKAMLPVEDNCKRSIIRYRPQLPTPAHLGELTIPAELTTTLDQDPQPFLLYDNGQDAKNRVIAFATEDNLRLLAEAHTFFMDGTFDTAPPLFKQICTIRIAFSTTHITAVYCLLQKKARVGYQELFQAIVDKCEELGLALNVTKVVSDFEDYVPSMLYSVVKWNTKVAFTT